MAISGKQVRTIIVVGLVAFAVSLAAFLSGGLALFELKAYDLFSRRFNPVSSAGDTVIVQIDQESIDALAGESITWPWPRQMYAPLLDYLAQADAVFIDIIYSEPSSYGQEDDNLFAEALRKAGNVYLALFLSSADKPLDAEARALLDRIALPPGAPPPRLTYRSAVTPIGTLHAAAHGAGNVMIKPDADGVYRRIPLLFGIEGRTIPQFFLGHLLEQGKVTAREGRLASDGIPLPLADDTLLLRYYRGEQPFPTVSAAALFKSHLDSQAGAKPAVSREWFKGKKVFIGLTAAGLYDLKPTSISAISTGVLVHATALDNLLHKGFVNPLPPVYVVAFMLLLVLLTCWFVLTHHNLAGNLAYFGAAASVTLAVPAFLLNSGLYLQIIPPLLALLVSLIMAAGYSYAIEGRERRFVRRAFAQYMDETIVQYLLKNPDLIKPGGQRRRVTVFFADIAGFTSIAEKLPPEETARILHTVLNAFTEVVIAHRGVIDKYIGDCIMAFWGAPLETGEDESNACRAAIHCQETLAEINRGFRADGLGEIAIRIGIHSGDAIVGNLGSDRLFDYTVVGDTVNLASRLEGANKQFKTRTMVSEETLSRTEGEFLTRELGLIEVKGKSQPVRIFELVAVSAEAGADVQQRVAAHREAMALFQEKRWQEAAACFNRIIQTCPGDGPAAYYARWCEELPATPALTNAWNVIKMTEK